MIKCPDCHYEENPDGAEFCEACGAELNQVLPLNDPAPKPFDYSPPPTIKMGEVDNSFTSNSSPQDVTHHSSNSGIAKLIAIQADSPIQEFSLNRSRLTIGKFDPDTGPVDINLDKFPDSDNISRHHAEIYQEGGQWKIKDLGSANGVFIRRANHNRFGARITLPEVINPGDEIAIAQTFFCFKTY